jgi:hypothetical protein
MNGYWIVKFGCKEWQDQMDFQEEAAARAWYDVHCQNPPVRGGKMVKWVALLDPNGKDVAGFATGGRYGKLV